MSHMDFSTLIVFLRLPLVLDRKLDLKGCVLILSLLLVMLHFFISWLATEKLFLKHEKESYQANSTCPPNPTPEKTKNKNFPGTTKQRKGNKLMSV